MKRREIIKRGLKYAALLSFVELPLANAASGSAEVPTALLASFIDTLIPGDTTPSASQLGMRQILIAHAQTIPNYTQLLHLGCQWLEAQSRAIYREGFADLTYERREAIVMMAQSNPQDSIPKMFFERALSDLFGFYYAHPASWGGLGIASPPQPGGYTDYTIKPRRTARG